MGDILTLSGLWYTSPDRSETHLTAAARRRATKDVVSTLAQPALTPPDLLALWAAQPFPLSAPAQPPPQPPTVSVLDHQSYMPWDYSLVTAYLVRGLPSWHVRCAAQLDVSLPVDPQWHLGDPVLLIVSPPATLYWALAQLAQAGVPPLWASLALLTAVPPGDSTLALPTPMTPYAARCGCTPQQVCSIDGPSLLQLQLSDSRQAETTPRCASVGQAEVGPSPPPT